MSTANRVEDNQNFADFAEMTNAVDSAAEIIQTVKSLEIQRSACAVRREVENIRPALMSP